MEYLNTRKMLTRYNSLYKEIDEVYHMLAKHYGLSDCALWIIYIIRESEEDHTQNKLCELLSLSKQTVNSALKKLEEKGYIRLEHSPGNQKNKLIYLTEPGKQFAAETIDHVIRMEQNAFSQFTPEERIAFLQLFEKYARQLQAESGKLVKTNEDEENRV